MLSRSAEGVYWLGRYLERAKHLCGLLQLQMEALVDRPVREILFGWSRIYGSMHRQPPGGSLDWEEGDAYTLADSYTLADDLTFEHSNPGSLWNCFAEARENARQMRHCISKDMWRSLNLTYLSIRKRDIIDFWGTSPETFYAETAASIDTFAGVAAATMYRSEGWQFMRLGGAIEQSQLTTALLLTQFATEKLSEDRFEADWTSLLHAYHAFAVYNRRYSIDVQPNQVLDLLVTDPLLPGALRRSLDAIVTKLDAIGPAPTGDGDAAQRLARRMHKLIEKDWPGENQREKLLETISTKSLDLHQRVTTAYFDYPIEASLTKN